MSKLSFDPNDSSKRLFARCAACGHSWRPLRLQEGDWISCPYCQNDMLLTAQDLKDNHLELPDATSRRWFG